MTFDRLRQAVHSANLATCEQGLVISTFGNVSGIDRSSGCVVIKPSGVSYAEMSSDQMVITDLEGRVSSGGLKPSTDLKTHLLLYAAFDGVGAIVHTHSTYATIFAQAHTPIPVMGTTHADYFHGEVPVTRKLRREEIEEDYVRATGKVIIETFADRDPVATPAALVAGHGPFVWGPDPATAVENAVILEEIARMAWHTRLLDPTVGPIDSALLDHHYYRKHGSAASYGQEPADGVVSSRGESPVSSVGEKAGVH